MCTRPLTIRLPPNPYERSIGITTPKVMQVPCGKCPECLAKRQKDISIRAYREALKFGSCYFLTLTYSPEHVPFAETLYSIDTTTGDVNVDKSSRICQSDMLDFLRKDYKGKQGLYVHEHHIATLEDTDFTVVYTPTLNYTDVRLKIKNFRVKWQREFGEKLPKFSYICVGEYGSKNSIRPHYHILVFGLSYSQVLYFKNMWDYGFSLLETVNFRNSDGSDGLAKVASYIGKYAAKGSFVPRTVRERLTVPCRLSASRGLGLDSLQKIKDYVCCFDIYGKYDINNYNFTEEKKSQLFQNVIDRLFYNFNGYNCALPNSICKKIFDYKSVDGVSCWSRLFYEVMAFKRGKYQEICDREFREFIDKHSDIPLSEACTLFENIRSADLQIRERSERERLSKFYSKSKL